MSYARSKRAIVKVENILKQLLEAKDDLAFPATEPQKLAYAIHEGLKSVAVYPEFSTYAELRNKFTFRVRQGKVIAEMKNKEIESIVAVRQQLSKMIIPVVSSVLGIVGAATSHKAPEMYFPDARINANELSELFQWSEPAGYYIINHDDMGLTITRTHPGEMNWTPKTKENGA